MKGIMHTIVIAGLLVGCASDADIAPNNVSKAADQFEVLRRVVFYNGITNDYILVVEGFCSLGNYDKTDRLSLTCKTGPGAFKKHYLGLSDNVTFFAEQIDPVSASTSHYRVIFKPSSIIPNIEVR